MSSPVKYTVPTLCFKTHIYNKVLNTFILPTMCFKTHIYNKVLNTFFQTSVL